MKQPSREEYQAMREREREAHRFAREFVTIMLLDQRDDDIPQRIINMSCVAETVVTYLAGFENDKQLVEASLALFRGNCEVREP
jgi:hypothetical protein